MKKLALMALLLSGSTVFSSDTPEQEVIRNLIEKAYINGAFNELNADDMEAGFHPGFAIFSAKGQELSRYPIAKWVASTRKRRSNADYSPEKSKMDYEITNIDVTGGAATAKVILSKDGKLIYTDYLSFLRFEDGWKVAAKVYHKH